MSYAEMGRGWEEEGGKREWRGFEIEETSNLVIEKNFLHGQVGGERTGWREQEKCKGVKGKTEGQGHPQLGQHLPPGALFSRLWL